MRPISVPNPKTGFLQPDGNLRLRASTSAFVTPSARPPERKRSQGIKVSTFQRRLDDVRIMSTMSIVASPPRLGKASLVDECLTGTALTSPTVQKPQSPDSEGGREADEQNEAW